MAEPQHRQRLNGLEPDNLLAFLALLGLLRALETSRSKWRPRAAWDLDRPPLRPLLFVAESASQAAICEAAVEGIATLTGATEFGAANNLKLDASEARDLLYRAAIGWSDAAGRYFADLCAALISDAALDREGKKITTTPLAYPRVARIDFLQGLKSLSGASLPEKKNRTRDPRYPQDAAQCIAQALFESWERLDRPPGLRWDPDEAKRHAYQWNAPTDEPPRTQHGANRLAIIGLSGLTAVPISSGRRVRLSVLGGQDDNSGFSLAWPIWREPATFAAIRALLSHPKLREPQAYGLSEIDHIVVARRISLGRYRNFTRAEPLR